MTNTQIGLVGLGALFVLFILRMPVGLSMLTVGFLGTAAISGFARACARSNSSSADPGIRWYGSIGAVPSFTAANRRRICSTDG